MKHYGLLLMLLSSLCLNSLAQQKVRSISDGRKRIYYTEVEEAENKLLEYIRTSADRRDFPSKLFVDLILNDERCFNYDFSLLVKASEKVTVRALRIITSDDGKLRLYTWDADGGTLSSYSGVTSFKNEIGVNSFASPIGDEYDMYDDKDKNLKTGMIACGATQIKTIPLNTEDKVYIVLSHASASNIMQIMSLDAYKIQNNGLFPYNLFPSESGYSSSLSLYVDPSYSNNTKIMLNDLELIIPETIKSLNPYACNRISGRNLKYKFIKERFEFVEISYSDNLYPELCDYKYNIIQINIAPWLIRIDKMPNGAIRYASWKNKSVKEKPDLIILNGYCASSEVEENKANEILGTLISKKEKYIFQNKDYFYEVSWIYEGGYEFTRLHSAKVIVKHNDKVLMTLTSH